MCMSPKTDPLQVDSCLNGMTGHWGHDVDHGVKVMDWSHISQPISLPLKATDYISNLGECLMEPGGRREWGDIHSHDILSSLNLHRSQLNLLSLTSQSALNNDYSLISETHIPKDRNFFD